MSATDADTHVLEYDDTFAYMEDSERQFVPTKGEMRGKDGRYVSSSWRVIERISAASRDPTSRSLEDFAREGAQKGLDAGVDP